MLLKREKEIVKNEKNAEIIKKHGIRVNKGKYKKQWQKSTKDKEIGSNKTREKDSNTVL